MNLGLARRAGRKRRLKGETRRRIERPDLAFIVELASATAHTGWLHSEPSPIKRMRESS
jgi:hypothetical protein